MQNNISVFEFFKVDDLSKFIERTVCENILKGLFSNEKRLKILLDKIFGEET